MATKIYDNKKKTNPEKAPQTVQQQIDSGKTPQYAENGLFHTAIPLQTISFKKSPNEDVIQNEGSFIVLGTDRPDGAASGYGGMGSNRANSIDLVVGRMSNARSGEGPPGQEDGTAQVDNSMFADAARVHISQLTNVDKNFGLAAGDTGPSMARSAVAVKADAVRVIGREGVNIVTGEANSVEGYGMTGETNSLGGKIIKPSPQINLIAGNHTGDYITFGGILHPLESIQNLQPAVRGELTRDAFLEYSEVTEDLIACMSTMAMTQIIFNSILGISVMEPWRAGASTWTVANQLTWVLTSLYQMRVTLNMTNFNYCNSAGYKYICSRNVFLT
jgi:hypothetical protein